MNEQHQKLSYEPIPPKKYNPFYGIVAFFLIVVLFFLSLQGYFYLMHPEPTAIPTLKEIQTFLPNNPKQSFTSNSSKKIKQVITATQNSIKQVANFVAAKSCKKADLVCQSKALFYFVRDRIQYVPDAQFNDQLENPLMVLKTGGADCEDMAVLLVALQKAIGNEVRLVYIPGHAYAQIKIPEYKNKWLNLEATCKTCKFNEVPEKNVLARKKFDEL